MDYMIRHEIADSINRIEQIVDSGVFSYQNSGHPLLRSAFTELMIHLNDLVQKAKKLDSKIKFTNEVSPDLVKLINDIRNTLCHQSSSLNLLDKDNRNRLNLSISYKKGVLATINGVELKSCYDDVCFFLGEQQIYLNHQIIPVKLISVFLFSNNEFIKRVDGVGWVGWVGDFSSLG